jgi:hypothetical protein
MPPTSLPGAVSVARAAGTMHVSVTPRAAHCIGRHGRLIVIDPVTSPY